MKALCNMSKSSLGRSEGLNRGNREAALIFAVPSIRGRTSLTE